MGRDTNRRPTHPGAVLREDVLPELNITQGVLAARLGVSRLSVSELLNERRALSPDMAVRLEAALPDTEAEMWLAMQAAVDLWEARRKLKVEDAADDEASNSLLDYEAMLNSILDSVERSTATNVVQQVPDFQFSDVLERMRAGPQSTSTGPVTEGTRGTT